MKLELKENMYIRTKDGYISQYKYYNTTNMGKLLCIPLSNGTFANIEDIVKASYKIMDLIEEKDLLEIEYFSLRYEKRVTRLFEVTYKKGRFINLDNAKCQFMLIDNDWTDNDKELEPIIKSIVTKKQMEQIAYKVGE